MIELEPYHSVTQIVLQLFSSCLRLLNAGITYRTPSFSQNSFYLLSISISRVWLTRCEIHGRRHWDPSELPLRSQK